MALSFFKNFLYSKVKNYENRDLFLSETWTTDNNHDILQSLIFSDFDKNKKVIDYRLPSSNNMILLLKKEFGFELKPKYTASKFHTRLNKIFELFINKLLNIRKQYLEETYKVKDDFKSRSELFKEYKSFIDLIDSKPEEPEGLSLTKDKREPSNPPPEVSDEIKARMDLMPDKLIQNPTKSDGEVRRRLRFMSEGKDSVYAFIKFPPKCIHHLYYFFLETNSFSFSARANISFSDITFIGIWAGSSPFICLTLLFSR